MSTVLNPICRGLVGYVSYLAACRTSTVYSEYLLYEPLLRIAQSQGYEVSCEVPVPKSSARRGDNERFDFRLKRDHELLALEVKWIKSKSPNIEKDIDKLKTYNSLTNASGYMLLFGKARFFENLTPKSTVSAIAKGKVVQWDAGKTKYCAQWIRYI